MPKSTFINLRPDKKDSFLADAFAEFSLRGFYGASITQLVKSLGIAKGSIYQYFDNKEALYEYLVEEACKRKLSFFGVLKNKGEANYDLNYLVISAKFDLTFPSNALLLYQGIISSEKQIQKRIYKDLITRIPALGSFSDVVYQRSIFMQSQLLFQILIEKANISIIDIINGKKPIEMEGSVIIETAQECLNSLKKANI